MDTHTLTTLGAIWVLCAVVAGIVASDKGRRFWVWFPLGILIGPVALYLALRTYEVVPPELAIICPGCHRAVRKTLRTCPRCGQVLVREPDPVMKAGRQAAAAYILLRRAAQRSTAVIRAEREKRQAKQRGERQ
ncbi:MAG TPA: hypothetical protein VKY56_05795 [Chloroflexota bacterium]|nr:hypothetical protein [Chloroflexota bacterium]